MSRLLLVEQQIVNFNCEMWCFSSDDLLVGPFCAMSDNISALQKQFIMKGNIKNAYALWEQNENYGILIKYENTK